MPARDIASPRGIASARGVASPRGWASPRGFTGVQAAGYLVEDTFTGDDAVTLPNHTPDIDEVGGGWQEGQGVWDIDGNKAAIESGAGGDNVNWIDAGQADTIFTCKLTTPGSGQFCGVVFRVQDGDNYLVAHIHAGDDELQLRRVIATVTVNIDTAAVPIDVSTEYDLRIETNGTSIEIYLDDVLLIDLAEAQWQTKTGYGFFQWNAVDKSTRWDDFRVSAL